MSDRWLNSVLDGSVKDASGAAVIALAEALDCDVSYLYGHQSTPRIDGKSYVTPVTDGIAIYVPVKGFVRSGVWIERDNDPEPIGTIAVDGSRENPLAKLVAFVVADGEMNNGDILQGDIIICWDREDYPFDLTDGTDVVIERSKDGGHLKELTVKRYYALPDGAQEFRPVSSDKSLKSVRLLPDEREPSVRVIAVVDEIVRRHRRTREVGQTRPPIPAFRSEMKSYREAIL